MPRSLTPNPPGICLPWDVEPERFLAFIGHQISHDEVAVAVLNPMKPQPDEVLVEHGCDTEVLVEWCDSDSAQDAMFKAAKAKGVVVAAKNDPIALDVPTKRQQVMMVMVPESVDGKRWWWMMLSRDGDAFTQAEQKRAAVLVRQWHTLFNQINEGGLGKVLVGHDDRVIMVDPWSEQLFLSKPELLPSLLEVLHTIRVQRWPMLTDNHQCDFGIELEGNRYWVVFHVGGGLDVKKSRRWYIEMRPLEEEELAPVGSLDDERISRSIAYLHDNFKTSPSLTEVSQAVHISPFHFHRLFSKQVGVSPKHYLQRKQLQIAKWLLRATRVPIGSIAAETGFASHGHFTSTFHRIVGVSPSEYRYSH